MRTSSLAAAAVVTLVGLTMSANGAEIAAGSELSLQGNNTFTASNTPTPTFAITFSNPANIGGTSGDFAAVFGAVPPQITGVVTMDNLSNTSTNFTLYTATVGADTTSLTAGSITSFTFTPGTPLESLNVIGTGTLTLTGHDPTPGSFDLTTQGPNGVANVTFSSTQIASPTAIPEPSSLVLLGAGLIGLGMWKARLV